MNETLREAVKILTDPADKAIQPLRPDRSHVFVLSPQPLGGLDPQDNFAPININAVCTAVVPYRSAPSAQCDNWILPRTLRFVPGSPEAPSATKDSDHLVTQAADVISYARAGSGFGAISDLSLDIRPRQGCSIESLLGATSSGVLKAGQSISALVRVKLPAHAHRSQSDPPTNSNDKLEHAFTDLEILLGETMTEFLTVKAHYRQSYFPDNSLITVERKCSIHRPNPASEWSITPQTDPILVSKIETELYQSFVFLIATHDPPQVVLDTLATFYENERCSLPCSDYIDRLRQELIYQIGAAPQQLGPPAATTTPYLPRFPEPPKIHTSVAAQINTRSNLRHYPSQPHFSFEPRDSLSFTATSTPTRQQAQRSVSASPLTDTHRCNPQAPPVNPGATVTDDTATAESGKCVATSDNAGGSSVDEARAIWRHMRRNVSIRASSPSRGTPSWPTGYRTVSQRQEMVREQRERELKRQALANKRSIGADTLRSLVMSSEAVGSEADVAPWL